MSKKNQRLVFSVIEAYDQKLELGSRAKKIRLFQSFDLSLTDRETNAPERDGERKKVR